MEQRFSSDAVFQSLKDQHPGLSHDSGYEELFHTSKAGTLETKFDMGKHFSFDCSLSCGMSKEKHPQNNARIGSTSNSTTPKNDRLRAKVTPRSPRKDTKKENSLSSGWCETPKNYKKDHSLRRRLLVSRAATEEKLGNTKASNSRLGSSSVAPSLEDDSSGSFDSPDTRLFEALVTSTLKNDEVFLSCRKRRLVFSQVKTSTLEDGKNKVPHPSASEAEVTEFLADQGDFNESIISSFPHHLTPELLETPCQSKFTSSTKENLQTPARDLNTNLCDELSVLSTPSLTPISKLDTSTCEDSGFSTLGLDKSQDSSVDHNGSFQELSLQSTTRGKETPRVAEARKKYRLERQRRLSTLNEGGSQSEENSRLVESLGSHGKIQLGGGKALATEEDELFLERTPLGSTTVKLEDLSLTPALQLVQAMCQCSARRLPEQTSLEELLCASEHGQAFKTTLPLSGLIGRKMGLDKLDILLELKKRGLRHILAMILNFLSSEDIYRFGQVSDLWNEIILQDKMTNRRRRSYLKDLKMAVELGIAAHVSDAETRLNLQCRSALRSVQAQAKPPVICTPILGNGTPVQPTAHSASKRDEFLQVAKTLFSDETLKPCPRCQHPARCHSVKREGICSREDCGFQFCTSCLCAYHGSKECGSWSAKRHSKKEVLPGSAQSKRNVRRL